MERTPLPESKPVCCWDLLFGDSLPRQEIPPSEAVYGVQNVGSTGSTQGMLPNSIMVSLALPRVR